MPPLTTAALRGHVRAARKLLELGARPDTQDSPPPPRTKWTRRVPHPVLIGHAASPPRQQDWDQWTALHYAAYIGTARHAEVADMLLAFGADLYETTWNGAPPSLRCMMASLPPPCPEGCLLRRGREGVYSRDTGRGNSREGGGG